jgi:hypothetical protein
MTTDFWKKVRIGELNECWPWRASQFPNGYGQYKTESTSLAHRHAYELVNGAIPDGLFVCHSCDTRLCCNPHHLFLGTHTANMRDSIIKGRFARGRRQPRCKLSPEAVRDIRASAARVGLGPLADKYGVSKSLVCLVAQRKKWAYVE